jgi:hypothetical protein
MNTDHWPGAIRPEHARDGWQFQGGQDREMLVKRFGERTARIRATTATSCAWSIYRADGRLLREASERHVRDAKNAVARWIREHP